MKRFILYIVGGEVRIIKADSYRNIDGFLVFYGGVYPVAQVAAHSVMAVDEERDGKVLPALAPIDQRSDEPCET